MRMRVVRAADQPPRKVAPSLAPDGSMIAVNDHSGSTNESAWGVILHDLTGLLIGDGETPPDLTVVVPDNDGGGIFAQLEPGEDRHGRDYRRVFGTPHGRDLVAVAQALGWAASAVSSPDELGPALVLGGPRVVVVGTDQRAEAELVRELRAAAAGALRG